MSIRGLILLFIARQCGANEVRLSDGPRLSGVTVDLDTFRNNNLECHNSYRNYHGVHPLTSDSMLDKISQDYAEKLAQLDEGLVHSKVGYGENLYSSYDIKDNGTNACHFWYDEIKLYNYSLNQPPNLGEVGHFTQMLWKGSCFVGSGFATSKAGNVYVVATYDPNGNVENEFRKHVLPPNTTVPSKETEASFDYILNNDVVCLKPDNATMLQQNLQCQNAARQRHCAAPLQYNQVMNDYAQKHAEWLAEKDSGLIFGNSPYQEFIQYFTGKNVNGFTMCRDMYQEIDNYNFMKHAPISDEKGYRRFTSMVWKSTQNTGFGTAISASRKTYVVIVYNPAQSTINDYIRNIESTRCSTGGIPPAPTIITNEPPGPEIPVINALVATPASTLAPITSEIERLRVENLHCHNYFRGIHGVPPLQYNDQINIIAQSHAEFLAQGELSPFFIETTDFSQNLLLTLADVTDGKFACNQWHRKHLNYPYDSEPNLTDDLSKFNEFTIMIWKNSQQTGFGIAKSLTGKTYIVSLYNPPGNIRGSYKENVLPPLTIYVPQLNTTTTEQSNDIANDQITQRIIELKPLGLSESTSHAPMLEINRENYVDAEIIEFSQQNLDCQNSFRSLHGSTLLSYKSELIKAAQHYATMLADANIETEVTKLIPYGVNIYSTDAKKIDGYKACYDWYSQFKHYSYENDNPLNSKETDYFTQMIWKNTLHTGIGLARSKTGKLFIVATYDPPGNSMNGFGQNIGRPQIFQDPVLNLLGRKLWLNVTVTGTALVLK